MSKDNKQHHVYVLLNPITKEVFYVGVTIKNLNDRLLTHIWSSNHKSKSKKSEFIKQLLDNGISPIIQTIEVVKDGINQYDREKFWIAYYKEQGSNLVNSTIGGMGLVGFEYSQEIRQKISLAHQGKVITAEQKLKQSIAMTGRTLTEAHKKKLSEAGKGRTPSKESILKSSLARKGKLQPKTAGEKNGRAILTNQQANEIKGSSMPLSEIMKIYGISKSQASRVRRGLQWN
jgi:hypothetical protein